MSELVEQETAPAPVTLKKLGQPHKQAMALLAQGVGRQQIAEAMGWTPEYITWLARQPICKDYLNGMAEVADAHMLALTERSVLAIDDALRNGGENSLKAAKLQLEAVGRIGKFRGQGIGMGNEDERLGQLAERLVGLLAEKRSSARVIDGTAVEVTAVSTEQSEATRQKIAGIRRNEQEIEDAR